VPRFNALAREWRATPPLNRLLAAALGLGRGNKSARNDLAAFVRAMTGAPPPD